jgi:hypothetical protein
MCANNARAHILEQSLIPPFDHLAGAERERKRLAAWNGRVEFRAIIQCAL